ncbi:hypothetical protein AB0N73_07750 [Microbacterium sp. NPDC089189]|uniref:hypothetical protein n=1 Tax=Microbacterium sp. NPDC089189 TaxID=3154972 RepID=UPI003420FE61
MIDVHARLDALIESGRETEAALVSTRLHPQRLVEGADPSGLVRVRWEGEEVTLEVSDGWERTLPAEELNGAVIAAMTDALSRRYDETTLRTGDEIIESPAVIPPQLDLKPFTTDPAFAAAIRRPDFPERLHALIAETERRTALRQSGRGPAGIVTARLGHDGAVTALLVDAGQAEGRRGADISRDGAAAIADARRHAAGTDDTTRPLSATEAIEVLNA